MGKEKLSLFKTFEAMVQDHTMPRYRNRNITIELKDDTVVEGHVTEYDPKYMNFTLAKVRMKPFRQRNTRREKRNKNEGTQDDWVYFPQMLVSGRRIRFVHLEQEDNVAEMLSGHLQSVGKRRNKLGSEREQRRKRKRSHISDERRAKFARMKEEAKVAKKRSKTSSTTKR